MKYNVICVGDAIVDAFLTIHDANIHCRLNTKDCELCVAYGQKIALDKCEFLLGGDACNVSVGLSRLDTRSSLCAEIGDDEFSQKIINGLTKEKVGLETLKRAKGASSSFSIGINFKGERTLFVNHVERKHDFDFTNSSAEWVYLSSMGKAWEGAYEKTLSFVQKNNARLAFNPGTPQLEKESGAVLNILQATKILFVNKEEATKVLSIKYKVLSIKEILEGLKKMGAKIVVVTDGENGSHAIGEKGQIYSFGVFPATVVEKTGAGDAYTSGFLAATINGKSIEEAMRWGAANAKAAIEKVGAQRGLLRRKEIESKYS